MEPSPAARDVPGGFGDSSPGGGRRSGGDVARWAERPCPDSTSVRRASRQFPTTAAPANQIRSGLPVRRGGKVGAHHAHIVVGTGHVGLTTAACLAHLGTRSSASTTTPEKISRIRAGRGALPRARVGELVREGLDTGRLRVSSETHQAARQRRRGVHLGQHPDQTERRGQPRHGRAGGPDDRR